MLFAETGNAVYYKSTKYLNVKPITGCSNCLFSIQIFFYIKDVTIIWNTIPEFRSCHNYRFANKFENNVEQFIAHFLKYLE
jgi:hypothetical protein